MTTNEAQNLNTIYNQFFSKQSCEQLMIMFNQFSLCDAVMVSGGTEGKSNILIEYKNRGCSISKYDDALIEVSKINRLQGLMKDMDAPAFFISEFQEVVLVFGIHRDKVYESTPVPCPTTSHFAHNGLVMKHCTFFQYYEADFIISKRTWTAGRYEQLMDYIMEKRSNE